MGFFDYVGFGKKTLAGRGLNKIGDLLSPTKIGPETVDEPAFYPRLRESIGNRLQGLISEGPSPYTGEFTAPSTDQEKLSLEKLDQFAAGGPSSLRTAGAQEIAKTLAGEYDPETSAYFQAFRDQRLFDLEESKTRLGNDLAGAGAFWTGGRQVATQGLEEQGTRDIAIQNAALAERERDRRFGAIGPAFEYGKYEEETPLRKAIALQGLGGLERGIDQRQLDALYSEFQRTENLTRSDLGQAASFAGDVPYYFPQYQDSSFMQLIKALAPPACQPFPARSYRRRTQRTRLLRFPLVEIAFDSSESDGRR